MNPKKELLWSLSVACKFEVEGPGLTEFVASRQVLLTPEVSARMDEERSC